MCQDGVPLKIMYVTVSLLPHLVCTEYVATLLFLLITLL